MLAEALTRLADPPPESWAEANERARELAIRFHEVPGPGTGTGPAAEVRHMIAASWPARPNSAGLVKLVDSPRPDQDTVHATWDWLAVGITAATGHYDAAAVQAGRTLLKENESLASGVTRCFADGLLVYLMPTAIIGKAVTMLSDAVREMNQKSEDQATTERRDFLTTQALGAFIRRGTT